MLSYLDQLSQPKILVLGDLILDEYILGEVKRISREAPVPIVEQKEQHHQPGGAANTLNNLASLQAQAIAVGVVGQDIPGTKLVELLQTLHIDTTGVFMDTQLPTTTKTRISAHSRQSVIQQLLRLDQLPKGQLSNESLTGILEFLQHTIPQVDSVIISDYGNGVINEQTIACCQQLCQIHHKPWIVDSQEHLGHFQGATVLTPNKPEAEQTLGYLIKDDTHLKQAGNELLHLTDAQAILITLGDEGMALFEQNGMTHRVPALNKTAVYDVTGAGDTVVATFSLALTSGLSYVDAMNLANLAASIVVRRLGASTTTRKEMKETLSHQPV